MKDKQNELYGLPSYLQNKVIVVGDEFRTNSLSLTPGGVNIVVEYLNDKVLLYSRIKYPRRYMPHITDSKGIYIQTERNMDDRETIAKISMNISSVYVKVHGVNDTYWKIWDNTQPPDVMLSKFEAIEEVVPRKGLIQKEEKIPKVMKEKKAKYTVKNDYIISKKDIRYSTKLIVEIANILELDDIFRETTVRTDEGFYNIYRLTDTAYVRLIRGVFGKFEDPYRRKIRYSNRIIIRLAEALDIDNVMEEVFISTDEGKKKIYNLSEEGYQKLVKAMGG